MQLAVKALAGLALCLVLTLPGCGDPLGPCKPVTEEVTVYRYQWDYLTDTLERFRGNLGAECVREKTTEVIYGSWILTEEVWRCTYCS